MKFFKKFSEVKQHPGFAIVAAIGFLSLLSFLSLSMVSIAQIGDRQNEKEIKQLMARRNAMLGLKIAAGHLQERMGIDEAISISEKNTKRNHPRWNKGWIGAWLPWEKAIEHFGLENMTGDASWLVSGNGIQNRFLLRDNLEDHGDTIILYRGHTDEGEPEDVRVPLMEIEYPNLQIGLGKMQNRYAYYVSDEGMKAFVGPVNTLGPEAHAYAAMPSKTGFEALATRIENPEEGEPEEILLEELARAEDIQRIYSVASFKRFLGIQNDSQLFESITFNSHGVLSDADQGGLKRDLSIGLAAAELPEELSSQGEIFPNGPRWNQLRNYYQTTHIPGVTPSKEARTYSTDAIGIYPTLLAFRLNIVAKTKILLIPHIFNPSIILGQKNTFYIGMSPQVVLWNPYNAPIKKRNYYISFSGPNHMSTRDHIKIKYLFLRHDNGDDVRAIDEGDGEGGISDRDADAEQGIDRGIRASDGGGEVNIFRKDTHPEQGINFELQMDSDLQPGETRVFLLDRNYFYKTGNIRNVLRENVNPQFIIGSNGEKIYTNTFDIELESYYSEHPNEALSKEMLSDFGDANKGTSFTLTLWKDRQTALSKGTPYQRIEGLRRGGYDFSGDNETLKGAEDSFYSMEAYRNPIAEIDPKWPENNKHTEAAKRLYSYHYQLALPYSAGLLMPVCGKLSTLWSRRNPIGPYSLPNSSENLNEIYEGGALFKEAYRQAHKGDSKHYYSKFPFFFEFGHDFSSITGERFCHYTYPERALDYQLLESGTFYFNSIPMTRYAEPFFNPLTSTLLRNDYENALRGHSEASEYFHNQATNEHVHHGYNASSAVLYQFPNPEKPYHSLAQLQHANLRPHAARYPHANIPNYAIGNSWLPAALEPTARSRELSQTQFNKNGYEQYDYCYELNKALWDKYFFSSIGYTTQGEPTTHQRLKRLNNEANGYENSAANYLNQGALNINTPYQNAWKVLLASNWKTQVEDQQGQIFDFANMPLDPEVPQSMFYRGDISYTENAILETFEPRHSVRIPFPRLQNPLKHRVLEHIDSDAWEGYYNGYRALNLRQLNELSRLLVEQTKVLGPWNSLSQFINRRKNFFIAYHRTEGPLQNAINEANINNFATIIEDGVSPHTEAISFGSEAKLSYKFRGKKIPYSAGAPGYLTQADVLTHVGHLISSRSDTFTIHFYGETNNPITGEIQAMARGRATLQRLPEFFDTNTPASAWPLTEDNDPAGLNRKFGRRFVITSIQWD